MFEYLSKKLPNFGLANWTSSVRTRCKLHPKYSNIGDLKNGIADLEYSDKDGVFTDLLLKHGYSARGIRKGMRPMYRFEVKTTTNTDWQTPFNISPVQAANVSLILPPWSSSLFLHRLTSL
jgi:hypothetical protein